MGSHGETIRGLFQPGFHSGTLPKSFARIRHAETRALLSGNYSAVRHYRANLQEIEESLERFAERELAALLAESPAWKDRPLAVGGIRFSSNLICFDMVRRGEVASEEPTKTLSITFENRDGWIVATVIGQPMFRRWCRMIGEEHWLADPRFADDQARGDHGELISERMGRWCAERSCEEALAGLEKASIVAGQVY